MAELNNRHNTIAVNSLGRLHNQLRGKACQAFNSDTKIRIEFPDHTRFYDPHAMVVCDSNSGNDQFQERSALIIEVLRASTRRTDPGEKRDAYLTMPSLKFLLFVESDFPSVTLYRRKSEGGFAAEQYTGIDATIWLPEIKASLALADLYERVELNA